MKLKALFVFAIFSLLSYGKYSFAEKVWPKYTLRGINTVLVASEGGNTQNPGGCISEETFVKFKEWNVNLIRVSLRVDHGSKWDVDKDVPVPADNPLLPYKEHLDALKVALQLAERYHIYIIPTARKVVGRSTGIIYNESDGSGFQSTLVELWTHVAKEFGTNQWLLAYDLLNGPHSENEKQFWQQQTLPLLIKEIREIDTNTFFVVEPVPWGNPGGFSAMEKVSDSKVVYSFGFYAPYTYTHQGIRKSKETKGMLTYRGMLQMYETSPVIFWDREEMLNYVKDAVDFQQRHNARMLVSEFGVVRWAPGASLWIEDAMSVFEEYGWDWCYLGDGGWDGWNPAIPADGS